MSNDFVCPYCKGKLNLKGNLVLSVKNQEGKSGLICLSPQLGNYKIETHSSFSLREGESTEYYCPICHSNLAALEFNENLVKILMVDSNQTVYEILFSGIAGEHCTYKIKGHEIESFGEDSQKYTNFFGAFPNY